ncbi:MAG: hypothetical protein V1484_00215 [bacterium]
METEKLGRNPDFPVEPMIEVYIEKIRKAEKLYGENWKKFLEENTDLINNIQEAIKNERKYGRLLNLSRNLLVNPKTRYLAERVDKEINIEGVGIYFWNQLNPLLEQAAKSMTKHGINPKDFCG